MRNLLKIKKRKITIFILLIFNQFLFNSYAVNFKKIYQENSTKNNFKNNINKNFDTLLVENKNGESQNLIQEAEEIEEFVEKVDRKMEGVEVLVNNAGITLDNLSIRLQKSTGKKF